MSLSGSFMRGAAVIPAAPPALNARHGQRRQPDTTWSKPPAEPAPLPSAGGYDDEAAPPMAGRGIVRDLGHQFGHTGTDLTAGSRRPFLGAHAQSRAIEAAAAAHGDTRAGYWPAHRYSPKPAPFAGESYTGDFAEGRPGESLPVRAVVKSKPGGEFSDGATGTVAPTGFRLGIGRRYMQARYSSPLLGAMWTSHVARGVLPQTIAVPVDQPARGSIFNSGLSSQQRWVSSLAVTPRLFRPPPSTSDSALAEQSAAPVVGPVI